MCLYKLSVESLVKQLIRGPHKEKTWEALSWIPANIYFDIFHQLFANAGCLEFRTVLLAELKQFDIFARLLNVGYRRSCLQKIVQFCRSQEADFFSPLIQEYSDSLGLITSQSDPNLVQEKIKTGLSFGGFLSEAGHHEEASRVYRACLQTVQHSTKELHWRIEVNCRLLNSLTHYYLLPEASQVYHQLSHQVETECLSIPKFVLCRVFSEFSTHHFLCSQYPESFAWSMKALKMLDNEVNNKVIIDVLRQASRSCIVKREFQKAEMLIKQAVVLCKNEYGPLHAKYADCLLDYGFYLLNVDSISQGMQVYESALLVRQQYFDGNNLKVAVAHEDLAYANYVLEYNSGQFQVARAHAEISLQIVENLVPKDHLLLASPKRVLALVLEEEAIDSVQEPKKKAMLLKYAESLHQFALRVSLQQFGERNVQTSKHYGNLGRLYQTMHRFKEAEMMHLKSIEIKESLLGPDDHEVALSVGHLASLYNYDMLEFKKAEALYLRSIKIGMKLYGPTYSGLEFDYRGLIRVYQSTENIECLVLYTNTLHSWKNLKEEKESQELERSGVSLLDLTPSVSFTEMLSTVTADQNHVHPPLPQP